MSTEYWETEEFIDDWKTSQRLSDECTSGPLKHIARLLWKRPYSICCCQHDFDYRFGHKYGISREDADKELFKCVKAASGTQGKEYHLIAWVVYIAVLNFGKVWYETENKLLKRGE